MSAAGLQGCLQCLCCSSLSSQGPIVCYLCKEEIKADLWYSGDHRRGCASRQTVQLSMLPSHPAVDCTHCDRRLRLWPDQEMAFTCDQCEYESSPGWDVVRYHCFPCDYTLCSDCARNIEAVLRGAWNRKPTENCAKMDPKLLVFQS